MHAVLLLLVLTPGLLAWNQEPDTNVNSRYTVESVEVPVKLERKLSDPLRDDIKRMIGEKYSQETVDKISRRLRRELRGYRVIQKITKGTNPENIRIVYEAIRAQREADVVLPRLVYHSKENFSFGVSTKFRNEKHALALGMLSDNDTKVERFSGILGGYQRTVAAGRFTAGLMVESWRSQWNAAVQDALAAHGTADGVPGIYRTRLDIRPGVTVQPLPWLTLGLGASLQRFETQFPAARRESSNALTTSLRLSQKFEPSNLGSHTVDAGYTLRAATKSFGSDFAYSRHAIEAHYDFRAKHEYLGATLTAGYISGRAPLFDRFILGNSTTLRGYNKYDVAPLGGSRMAHGSVDYRHDWIRVVYDTGAVYDRGQQARVRHSIAAGISQGHGKDSLSLLVAFPLKEGRAEPIFILGMNF